LFRQFSLPLAFAAVFPNTLHAQEDSFSHCSSNGKSAVVFHTGNSNQTTQPYITFQITSGNQILEKALNYILMEAFYHTKNFIKACH